MASLLQLPEVQKCVDNFLNRLKGTSPLNIQLTIQYNNNNKALDN